MTTSKRIVSSINTAIYPSATISTGGESVHTFSLPWAPSVNTYWRSTWIKGRGIVVLLSRRGRKYKTDAYAAMHRQRVDSGNPEARYELFIDAYPPDRRRRDLDNILKPILDVLEEYGALPDDEQIDILTVRRRGHKKPGHVNIRLSEIDPEDSLVP